MDTYKPLRNYAEVKTAGDLRSFIAQFSNDTPVTIELEQFGADIPGTDPVLRFTAHIPLNPLPGQTGHSSIHDD